LSQKEKSSKEANQIRTNLSLKIRMSSLSFLTKPLLKQIGNLFRFLTNLKYLNLPQNIIKIKPGRKNYKKKHLKKIL
jgi:hypothetical protein